MMMSTSKRTTLCAACIALCYVLPIAFHSVGLDGALSPMHIPVLSSLLSGMSPMLMLFRMIPELCVYGLAAGFAELFYMYEEIDDRWSE